MRWRWNWWDEAHNILILWPHIYSDYDMYKISPTYQCSWSPDSLCCSRQNENLSIKSSHLQRYPSSVFFSPVMRCVTVNNWTGRSWHKKLYLKLLSFFFFSNFLEFFSRLSFALGDTSLLKLKWASVDFAHQGRQLVTCSESTELIGVY